MGHPVLAYSFNEHSTECCAGKAAISDVLNLLQRSRGWHLENAQPLVKRLKTLGAFQDPSLARMNAKLTLLALSADRRRQPEAIWLWQGRQALGFSVAVDLGGFALSWPCDCGLWGSESVELTSGDHACGCRHASTVDHLIKNWQNASRLAKARKGRPGTVRRVDDAQNPSAAEVPHIVFDCGSSLNIDGTWKHGGRRLSAAERKWLLAVGWVLPSVAPVEVR